METLTADAADNVCTEKVCFFPNPKELKLIESLSEQLIGVADFQQISMSHNSYYEHCGCSSQLSSDTLYMYQENIPHAL